MNCRFTREAVPGADCPEGVERGTRFCLDNEGSIWLESREFQDRNHVLIYSKAVAVVMSAGPNGAGALPWRLGGVTVSNPLPAGYDERDNIGRGNLGGVGESPDGDTLGDDRPRHYIVRDFTAGPQTAAICDDEDEDEFFCEFDDMVRWISTPYFMSKMIEAGRLP